MTPWPRGEDDLSETFRSLPETPDFSVSILDRVDRRRGFLSRRGRTLLRAARWGAAAVAVGFLAGVFMLRESEPVAAVTGHDTAGPMARVVEAVAEHGSRAVLEAPTRVRLISQDAVKASFGEAFRAATERAVCPSHAAVVCIAPPHAVQPPIGDIPVQIHPPPSEPFEVWASGFDPNAQPGGVWSPMVPASFDPTRFDVDDTFALGGFGPTR